jgi:hypothetical protein
MRLERYRALRRYLYCAEWELQMVHAELCYDDASVWTRLVPARAAAKTEPGPFFTNFPQPLQAAAVTYGVLRGHCPSSQSRELGALQSLVTFGIAGQVK